MFVLCPKCHNHYEDASQSPECAGIGSAASFPTAAGSAHQIIAPAPITEHVNGPRAAQNRTATGR
jgi:hypothetical protein